MAGTKDAVLMVESEASGLTEEEMLDAVKFGHECVLFQLFQIQFLSGFLLGREGSKSPS